MTLRELLKDKQLPVRVRNMEMANKFIFVTFVGNDKCFTKADNGYEDSWSLDSDSWALYQEPRPKYRLWVCTSKSNHIKGALTLIPEDESCLGDWQPISIEDIL